MSDLKKQSDIVKQRLEYHFRGTDGTWIFPNNLPFMNEFLNEVDKMCSQINAENSPHILIKKDK